MRLIVSSICLVVKERLLVNLLVSLLLNLQWKLPSQQNLHFLLCLSLLLFIQVLWILLQNLIGSTQLFHKVHSLIIHHLQNWIISQVRLFLKTLLCIHHHFLHYHLHLNLWSFLLHLIIPKTQVQLLILHHLFHLSYLHQ